MKTRCVKLMLVLLLGFILSQDAQAFYNSSTGRWLNRDPLGDAAFAFAYISQNPDLSEKLYSESLFPPYLFARNDGVNRFDRTGLDADVTWNPSSSSCGRGESTAFIQVGYGGWGPYKAPFTDDGSKGFGASGTSCPEYPNFGRPGGFEDSPKGVTGPVKFIVCQICTESCCGDDPKKGQLGSKIVRIVACKTWKKGDTGPLGKAGAFPDATMQEILLWRNTVAAKYPNWMKCYKCKHKP